MKEIIIGIALFLCVNIQAQEFISIGNDTIEYELTGHGEPWIVMISGVGGDLDAFQEVRDFLARETTVLCYSRSGLGQSTYHAGTKTFDSTIDELKALLSILDAPANIILGAHSYGGLVARAFATKFPDGVKGIVLVDPTFEDYFKVLSEIEPNAEEIETGLYFPEEYEAQQKGRDDDVRSMFEVWKSAERWESWFNVQAHIPQFVLTSMKTYPNRKLRDSEELMQTRYEPQRRMVVNSKLHLQMAIPDAGHPVQYEKTGITYDAFMMMLNICR